MNPMLTESLAAPLGAELVRMSWQGALLALFVLAVTVAWRRGPAAFKYALWLLVVAKLLVPMPFSLPTGAVNYLPPAALEPEPLRVVERTDPRVATETVAAVAAPAPAFELSLGTVLVAAWALVALAIIGVGLARYRRTRRLLLRSAYAPPAAAAALFDDLRRRLGLRRPVGFYASESIAGPLVMGPLRPLVVVPGRLFEELTPCELEMLLAHELAHVRRLDHIAVFIELLALAAHFFNPLAWLALRRLRAERERACDERVVALLGAREEDYGQSLLRVARHIQASLRPAGALALAEGDLSARVHYLLNPRRRRMARLSLPALFALALIGCVVLPGRVREKEATADAADLNQTYELAPGEAVSVGEATFSLLAILPHQVALNADAPGTKGATVVLMAGETMPLQMPSGNGPVYRLTAEKIMRDENRAQLRIEMEQPKAASENAMLPEKFILPGQQGLAWESITSDSIQFSEGGMAHWVGNVRIKHESFEAEAEEATFYPADGQLVLQGSPAVLRKMHPARSDQPASSTAAMTESRGEIISIQQLEDGKIHVRMEGVRPQTRHFPALTTATFSLRPLEDVDDRYLSAFTNRLREAIELFLNQPEAGAAAAGDTRQISYDEETVTLTITDTPEKLEQVREYLESLPELQDKKQDVSTLSKGALKLKEQIQQRRFDQLKAEFLFEVEWLQLSPAAFARLLQGDELEAGRLEAVLADPQTRVLARPRLVALDGESSTFKIGDDEAGYSLSLKPQLLADGQILLEFAAVNNARDRKKVVTDLRIKPGQWMIGASYDDGSTMELVLIRAQRQGEAPAPATAPPSSATINDSSDVPKVELPPGVNLIVHDRKQVTPEGVIHWQGNVEVDHEQFKALADEATYDPSTRQMVLHGEPAIFTQLLPHKSIIRGSNITLTFEEDGKIKLEAVKGEVSFPAQPPTKDER